MATEKQLVRERFNDALRRQVESVIGLPIGEPTVGYWSVTGEPYVTMTNGGIKLEGEMYPAFAWSRATALRAYLAWCEDYAADQQRAGAMPAPVVPPARSLYWRCYPTILEYDDGTWTVYSRLLISDKPINAAAVKALAA